jgi:tetratricopeptide (TPR) repeat protein
MFQVSAEQARDAGNLLEAQAEYKATVAKLDLAITHGEGAWYIEEAHKRRAESADFLDRYQESLGYLTVGGVLGAQNRLGEALAVFDASARRFPYDYQPFLNIGAILTELKQYDQAQAALEQAAKVNPQSPKPYLQMGFLFEAQERVDDAIAAYQKVVELAPDAPEPREALGTVLLQKDRFEEATQQFEKAVELSGGTATPLVHWNLAFLYSQEGRNSLALQQYRITRTSWQEDRARGRGPAAIRGGQHRHAGGALAVVSVHLAGDALGLRQQYRLKADRSRGRSVQPDRGHGDVLAGQRAAVQASGNIRSRADLLPAASAGRGYVHGVGGLGGLRGETDHRHQRGVPLVLRSRQ